MALYHFSFSKNKDRQQLWLKACNMKLYLPSYKICNDHFSPENYLPSGYLKNNAVPLLASTSTGMYQNIHYKTLFAYITSQSTLINSIMSF